MPLTTPTDTIHRLKRLTVPTPKTILLLLTLAVCSAALLTPFALRQRAPFIMDEFVDMQLAVQVDRGVGLYAELLFERMPLMTYILGWAHDATASSFHNAIAGRGLASLASQLIVLGIFATAATLLSWRYALPAVLLGVTFSDFIDQSFRIRADVFATLFALPALYVACSRRLGRVNAMLAGFAMGLALVTTQKAAYFAIAFGFAVGVRRLFDLRSSPFGTCVRSILSLGAATAFGTALPLASVFVWAAMTGQWQGFVEHCLLHGARAGLMADSYDFTTMYVWQSLHRNPVFWALGLSGVAGILVQSASKESLNDASDASQTRRSQEIGLGIWTATLLLMFLQHTTKFPYIFVNLTPCLAVCGAWVLAQLGQAASRDRWPAWMTVACLGGLAAGMLHAWPHYERNRSNRLILEQVAVMHRVDAITTPNDAVFDGIGMATTRINAVPYSLTKRFFDERRAGANLPILSYLLERQPTVAIDNYRWLALDKVEKDYLSTHFVQDWSNVWVAGTSIAHQGPGRSDHTIHVGAATQYAVLLEKDARITIDNRPATPRVHLDVGMHSVSIEGESQTVLLKYARAVDKPPPPPKASQHLYPSYSD